MMRLASSSVLRCAARATAAPTSSATVLIVSISAAVQLRSLRQSSKPITPSHWPSANTGTASTDLTPPSSKNARFSGSKSRTWPAMVSPASSARDPRLQADIGQRLLGVLKFRRRGEAGSTPDEMLQDVALGARRVDQENMRAVNVDGLPDALDRFRQRYRQVGRAQQFLGGHRHRLQQTVAAQRFENGQRAARARIVRPCPVAGARTAIGVDTWRGVPRRHGMELIR